MLTNNDLEFSDEQTDEEQQAVVDQYFELLCTTECGAFIFAVSEECGVGSEIQAVKAFCGSNSNEDICYELFIDYFNYYEIELNCTVDNFFTAGTCECQSELQTAVDDLGCCIDAYHQLVIIINEGAFNPRDIYDSCDVDLPTGCTNGAYHIMYIFYMLYAMAVIAVLMA